MGKGMTSLEFLVGYTTFFLFSTYLFGLIGQTVFSSVATPSVACEIDAGWLAVFQMIACAGSNFIYFFTLMTISTEYQLLGTVLITPFLVGVLWVIVSWMRGVDS